MRFPLIRGDVPSIYLNLLGMVKFSPHTRGCSYQAAAPSPNHQVFPAYAGMFLVVMGPPCGGKSFPRIRGDVPGALT